jgi:hypothetical protein
MRGLAENICIYLIKDWYLSYTKNSQDLTIKKRASNPIRKWAKNRDIPSKRTYR